MLCSKAQCLTGIEEVNSKQPAARNSRPRIRQASASMSAEKRPQATRPDAASGPQVATPGPLLSSNTSSNCPEVN